LTSALSVLEIQCENAEKENKRLRSAGAKSSSAAGKAGATTAVVTDAGADTGSATSGAAAAAVTAALLSRESVWRSIAAHRLLVSMKPLPALPGGHQNATGLETLPIAPSPDGHPLKTYRDLRKMRSLMKVKQPRGLQHPDPVSVS